MRSLINENLLKDKIRHMPPQWPPSGHRKDYMFFSIGHFIKVYTLTYSQRARVGTRSRTQVGSGSSPDRQQSSPVADRT